MDPSNRKILTLFVVYLVSLTALIGIVVAAGVLDVSSRWLAVGLLALLVTMLVASRMLNRELRKARVRSESNYTLAQSNAAAATVRAIYISLAIAAASAFAAVGGTYFPAFQIYGFGLAAVLFSLACVVMVRGIARFRRELERGSE